MDVHEDESFYLHIGLLMLYFLCSFNTFKNNNQVDTLILKLNKYELSLPLAA